MKAIFVWLPLGIILLFISCGDGEKSGLDYDELCAVSCAVDDTCDLLGGTSVEQCIAACRETTENQLDDFVEAFMNCKEEKTCEELSEGGENSTVCYDENIGECTTDTEEYLDVACTVKLECDGIDKPTEAQLNDCKATMHGDGNILRCFRAAKLAEAVDCIEKAECTPDPVRTCVENVLGLILGNENTSPGGGGGSGQ